MQVQIDPQRRILSRQYDCLLLPEKGFILFAAFEFTD